jgi:hypothetical protein
MLPFVLIASVLHLGIAPAYSTLYAYQILLFIWHHDIMLASQDRNVCLPKAETASGVSADLIRTFFILVRQILLPSM